MNNGKLIIFEGIDGSGKSSQFRRTCEKMSAEQINFSKISFPRYDKESSALIRLYLGGAFGTAPTDVNAYAASLFYAVDRFASYRDDWGLKYKSGELIMGDRYTTSNLVHQGAKLSNEELSGFFDWIADLEYIKLGLPEPDCVFYLDVDVDTSLRRMMHRREVDGSVADIHEKDKSYLEKCLTVADRACDFFSWKRIPYLNDDGSEISLEDKNSIIFRILKIDFYEL